MGYLSILFVFFLQSVTLTKNKRQFMSSIAYCSTPNQHNPAARIIPDFLNIIIEAFMRNFLEHSIFPFINGHYLSLFREYFLNEKFMYVFC